jgi:mannose-6-phosphate isomerase-like protein (cupin superfamily)
MDGSDTPRVPTLRVTAEQARSLPNEPGHPSARAMAHGTMEVRWFVPQPGDEHHPHDRDELYVVVSGSASFVRSNEADPFEEDPLFILGEEITTVQHGDVLFVPAGARHRFTEFTPDFAVWAVFYGPEGGEKP